MPIDKAIKWGSFEYWILCDNRTQRIPISCYDTMFVDNNKDNSKQTFVSFLSIKSL